MITDLRNEIAAAIRLPFEAAYKETNVSYDPDDCFRAADEVIAVLLTNLTGEKWQAVPHSTLIGPARFVNVEPSGTV